MSIQSVLETKVKEGFIALYNVEIPEVEFQATRKDFEGDITVVVFPLLRYRKGNPVQIGTDLGNYLVENVQEVSKFNVVKGFLNLVIDDSFYINFFNEIATNDRYGYATTGTDARMVEYSSPNTNKPLHLGHVRNVLLGYSVSEILKAAGHKVYKTQIVNDRGIHICKSMLAWKRFAPLGKDGKKETPKTTYNEDLKKGDKLVGHYYVEFDKEFKKQLGNHLDNVNSSINKKLNTQIDNGVFNLYEAIKNAEISNEYHNQISLSVREFYKFYKNLNDQKFSQLIKENNYSNLDYLFRDDIALNDFNEARNKFLESYKLIFLTEGVPDKQLNKYDRKVKSLLEEQFTSIVEILNSAKKMLRKWESGDEETVALWKTMNGWVYEGFDVTYKNIGVDFDKLYYESNTYLLGKDVIEQGLKDGVFLKKEDGSVWCDLTEDGLDEKLVLRSDGTAVYMTQDIGTAIQRAKDFTDLNGMVYTVGNEQDYHFKVLFLILKKLGYNWADQLYHLSYGMVDLPSGKMKSREGTVVDADDLMDEMTNTAREISQELGKLEGYSNEEKEVLYNIIGLGALKYFILKVDPKKRILFDPQASVDFQGNSGPFIQMAYARVQSILRKTTFDYSKTISGIELHEKEKELIKQLELYPEVIQQAAKNYSPAVVANYTYDLVKEFNSFYQNVSILGEENEDKKIFRVQLSKKVAETIESAFRLLGINVPERM